MPDNVVLNSKGKPFTSKIYAEKFLPDGYVAVERDGGWVGIKWYAHVAPKNISERNQISMATLLSDASVS